MAAIDEQLDAKAKAELDADGMTVLEGLLTPEQTARALAALMELFSDGHAEDQHKDLHYSMNLTARDEIFREVVTLPRLVSLESHLLGDNYVLSGASQRRRQAGPGGPAICWRACCEEVPWNAVHVWLRSVCPCATCSVVVQMWSPSPRCPATTPRICTAMAATLTTSSRAEENRTAASAMPTA